MCPASWRRQDGAKLRSSLKVGVTVFESAGRTVLLIEGQVGVRSATGAILLAEGSFNT